MRARLVAGLLTGVVVVAACAWDRSCDVSDGAQAPRSVTTVEPPTPGQRPPRRRRRGVEATPTPPHPDTTAPPSQPEEPEGPRPSKDEVEDAPPIETGNNALRVQLTDVETGEHVAMTVALWRLGLPETERFTAGDVLYARVTVPARGTTIDGLPAGRYRLHCEGQRKGAEDPQELDIVDGTAEADAWVRVPRHYPARLVVFDEEGRRITGGSLVPGGGGGLNLDPVPDWGTPMKRKGQRPFNRRGGYRTFSLSPSYSKWEAQGPDGFGLRTVREDTYTSTAFSDWTLSVPGRTTVQVVVRGEHAPDPTYVAPSVPASVLLAGVRYLDGSAVVAADAGVEVACSAIHVGDTDPETAWRNGRFEVSIRADHYRELRFEWSPHSDGSAVVERVLVSEVRR